MSSKCGVIGGGEEHSVQLGKRSKLISIAAAYQQLIFKLKSAVVLGKRFVSKGARKLFLGNVRKERNEGEKFPSILCEHTIHSSKVRFCKIPEVFRPGNGYEMKEKLCKTLADLKKKLSSC